MFIFKKTIILLYQGIIGVLALSLLFMSIEPTVSFGAATSQFSTSQSVTSEISFVLSASNVTMSLSLGGLTGGTANGSTQVVVNTSNTNGYNMTIQANSSNGMQGIASSTNYIPAYVSSVAGVPDYAFSSETNSAGFGYTVNASTTSDVAQLFRNSSSNCNQSAGSPDGSHCWLAATTSPVQIVNRSTQTPSTGATTTLSFRVVIGANPSPVIPNDTYVATTTLTATTNP